MTESFRTTLESIPGLVPVEVNPRARGIAWGDIGSIELRQSFYDWGLRECHESTGIKSITQTPLKVLQEQDLIPDALAPSGFVFHMARCGSSLLAKALAHGQGNLVISEPEPLNQLLFFLTDNKLTQQIEEPDKLRMLRNMVLALGRKRGLDNSRYYLKFSSWNVLQAETICNIFPQVPCLFLYRNPEEVMVSIAKGPTGFSQGKAHQIGVAMSGCDRASLDKMSQQQYVAAVLAQMARHAISQPNMHFLDYSRIDAEHFPQVLELFGHQPDETSMQAMCEQFKYDSKQSQGLSSFSQDTTSKQAAVTPAIQDACDEWLAAPIRAMRESTGNLVT